MTAATVTNIESALEKIMSRLSQRAGDVGLAVFVTPAGDVKATTITTDLFRFVMRTYPERLLGVYNEDAEDRWIREDLRWASVNMVGAAS